MRPRALVLAVTLMLLLLASPALAAPRGEPVRLWSISNIRQGIGEQEVTGGGQIGDVLDKTVALGPAVFNFPESRPGNHAIANVFSSADGTHYSVLAQAPSLNPFQPRSPKGGVSHLDEFQAYEKRSGDASLTITVTQAIVDVIDDNGQLGRGECPRVPRCPPIRATIGFHARAYAASAGGDFFNVGGTAYVEGHQGAWAFDAVTSSDSPHPLWSTNSFDQDPDPDGSGSGARFIAMLNIKHRPFHPNTLRIKVPLASVRDGELFAVHVRLDATTIDERGRESAAEAFIQDPQHEGPALLATHGLRPRGKPRFKEPKLEAPRPAQCPRGRPKRSGALQLSAPAFVAGEGSGTPMVLVTRRGGTRGSASAVLSTRGNSAKAGSDFKQRSTRVRFASGDRSSRLVEIPIREDLKAESPEKLTVTLGQVRCARQGGRRRATVTILDDDAPSTQPPTGFTIGGNVDGLEGSGLVLDDLGTDLAVSGNGRFNFPGTRAAGLGYDVRVTAQPHSPDQACTVERGGGTVAAAVTDIAVHCTTPDSSGLDQTFGTGGRVSTPVGGAGQGEAVVIQSDGKIVTAGRTGTATGLDFALTRHDSSGHLDPAYSGDGIVSTDLGSADDQAFDAALLPGGGIVAVGRTLGSGAQNLDLALVCYRTDGTPDPNFGSGGIVKTDVFGSGDQANAVAVQPDGKIVVAGFATSGALPDGDFVLVRYGADGKRDPTFGDDGIVTTDLGTRNDDARALVIRPDGRIVVAGTVGENVALAQYTAGGKLDTTFGDHGIRISDFGSEGVTNGVALTADGHILIAGFTVGAGGNRDFLLARYTSGGALETSFGDSGKVTTDLGGGDDFAENLLVDSFGRIVLVGRATSFTILDMALVRYDAAGRLDTSFDGDGVLTTDFHGRGDFGQDAALDASGRIVAAGYTGNATGTELALIRANP